MQLDPQEKNRQNNPLQSPLIYWGILLMKVLNPLSSIMDSFIFAVLLFTTWSSFAISGTEHPSLRGDSLNRVDTFALVGESHYDMLVNSGAKGIRRARTMESRSRTLLLNANAIRREIHQARVQLRRLEGSASAKVQALSSRIAELNSKLQDTQAQGASLRQESKALHLRARETFVRGLQGYFPDWVTLLEPLAVADNSSMFISHNTQMRSVHPRLLNQMTAAVAEQQQIADKEKHQEKPSLTLQIASLSGQNAPSDLDVSRYRLSRQQRYFAYIAVQDTKLNNKIEVPLNSIHQWRLVLTDLNGKAVAGANIEVGGHMPGHVHGLPTQPRVTEELAPGVYLVDGVKFQMRGWWVMSFKIHSSIAAQNDSLAFNVVL